MLPRPLFKEQRVMLYGAFEVNGKGTLTFACTHLDYFAEETRFMQIRAIIEALEQSPYPVIFGGDFNAEPNSKTITEGMKNWQPLTNNEFTFPSHQPEEKLDYLFGLPKEAWRVVRTQTIHSLLSDHLPIITELELIQ